MRYRQESGGRSLILLLMQPTIITKPKVEISQDLLDQVKSQAEEQGQVVMHFIFTNIHPVPTMIRIWPTTFLYDHSSDHVSELVHVHNISMFPVWQDVPPLAEIFFTLIFSGLPKSCTSFDFEEVCDGTGGEFALEGIERNGSDVYWVEVRG